MYQDLSLENKIRFAEMELSCRQKAIEFWSQKEKELKDKYGKFPSEIQCRHIKAIKGYRKEEESELKYWANELSELKRKISLYNVFS